MKRVSWGLAVATILVVGLFSFQNCSKTGSFNSDTTVFDTASFNSTSGDDVADDLSNIGGTTSGSSGASSGTSGGSSSGTTGGSSGGSSGGSTSGATGGSSGGVSGGSTGSTVGNIDPAICYRDYFSIYDWTNSASDLSTTGLQMGNIKRATIKIHQEKSPGQLVPGAAWSVNARIQTSSSGGTQVTVVIDKDGESEQESLLCNFGPDPNNSNNEAKTIFENIGSGLMINFVGYISSSSKWIACKILKGGRKVAFQSADASPTSANYETDQPFVIKRGCGQ